MEPLDISDIKIPPPSCLEKTLIYFPVIGWIIANEIYQRRIWPVKQSLYSQFSKRCRCYNWSELPDEFDELFVTAISSALSDCFNWPHSWFHPLDPMSLVMFDNDLGYVEFLNWFEDEYSIDRNKMPSENTVYSQTVGEFLKKIKCVLDRK